MASFADSVKKNVNKILVDIDRQITDVFIKAATKVVDYSPKQPYANYSKGLLINNWFVGVNSINTLTTTGVSDNGDGSRSRIASTPYGTFLGKNGKLTLTNNLPYAYRAEKLGWPAEDSPPGWQWTGTVLPYAMLTKAVLEVGSELK